MFRFLSLMLMLAISHPAWSVDTALDGHWCDQDGDFEIRISEGYQVEDWYPAETFEVVPHANGRPGEYSLIFSQDFLNTGFELPEGFGPAGFFRLNPGGNLTYLNMVLRRMEDLATEAVDLEPCPAPLIN